MAVRVAGRLGLSPRVRGNPAESDVGAGTLRSIPACAGEPPRPRRAYPRIPVYPRVCGGTTFPAGSCVTIAGLSPRVRGNHRQRHNVIALQGSIPACAGEPPPGGKGKMQTLVYPRVCGGTAHRNFDRRALLGLSPRVRGNQGGIWRGCAAGGSIPACAGEPAALRVETMRDRVYPRVCGGTPRTGERVSIVYGLSPRVRGNRRKEQLPNGHIRSIPACAGEPTWRRDAGRGPKVYPRVCGGTPDGQRVGLVAPRSIPACAGEPLT